MSQEFDRLVDRLVETVPARHWYETAAILLGKLGGEATITEKDYEEFTTRIIMMDPGPDPAEMRVHITLMEPVEIAALAPQKPGE